MPSIDTLEELTLQARLFVQAHPRGGAFGLRGDLGVGKTSFVREVIRSICESSQQKFPRVVSPSYVLHQLYETTPPVDHFDLYRMEKLTTEGLLDLGYFEAAQRAQQGGFLFVEWPERLPASEKLTAVLDFRFTPQGREFSLRQGGR